MTDGINMIVADSDIAESRIAIVMSKYNSYIVDRLLRACLATLHSGGIDNKTITLVKVPGAVEIPVAARQLAMQDNYDAIICLGAIIRGETPHFDIIARTCADGLTRVALDYGLPVIFGVLTVDNSQQAADRSGDEESNKGSEAALAAMEMISVLRQIGT